MKINDKILEAICQDIVLHTISVNKNREVTVENYKELVDKYLKSDNFKEDFLEVRRPNGFF
jgi:hypothetical protein